MMKILSCLFILKSDKVNANEYYYGEEIKQQTDKVVLRDLPTSMEDLSNSCNNCNFLNFYSFAT